MSYEYERARLERELRDPYNQDRWVEEKQLKALDAAYRQNQGRGKKTFDDDGWGT